MRRVFAAFGWLLAFMLAGGVAVEAAAIIVAPHHPIPTKALAMLGGMGGEFGVNLWLLALCFARLPGARAPRWGRPRLGLVEGLWGMLGFGLTMGAGGGLFVNVRMAAAFYLILQHTGFRPSLTDPVTLTGAVLAGEFMTALWLAWSMRRLGLPHLADGSPRGVAWRSAPAVAYAQVVLLALLLAGVVVGMYKLVPPDLKSLENLPSAKLFEGPPITIAAMLGVVLLLGPVLEEIAFRGIGFAGVASRLGSGGAVAVTTLLFLAAHGPEKLHYLPGFLDVGLLALASCHLRLRYGSIRPGILLHMLYNGFGLVAAAALT
ncbi:MAG TPA: CPBP family intramembrane glutamic endopeptidase [Acidocella sp.]|nr:CPBP family intramembrane glutamic endopeptidase [Acidocella sp.]